MSQPLSIVDTHNAIINVVPENQKQLLDDLCNFISKLNEEKRPQKYYTEKHVLLRYLPKRQLNNSDPNWMWDCQEVFSSSFNK